MCSCDTCCCCELCCWQPLPAMACWAAFSSVLATCWTPAALCTCKALQHGHLDIPRTSAAGPAALPVRVEQDGMVTDDNIVELDILRGTLTGRRRQSGTALRSGTRDTLTKTLTGMSIPSGASESSKD